MPTEATAPVVTKGAPAQAPSSESYQSNALAALKSQGVQSAPAQPAVAAPAQAPVEPSKTAAPSEGKENPANAPPVPKVESDSIKSSFERMAKEKSEIRQMKEQLRDLENVAKVFNPQQLKGLAQALAARDPVAALAAAGFSHTDYTNAVLGARTQPKAQPQQQDDREEPSDDVAILRRELDEMKLERQKERIARGRASTVERLKALAAGGKYELVREFGDEAAHEALMVLEEYVQSTGVVPQGKELEELYDLSLQYVDGRLKEQRARWERALTKKDNANTVPNIEVPESPRATSAPAGMTLTNAVTPSGSRPAGTPKSDEDFQAAALEVLRKLR